MFAHIISTWKRHPLRRRTRPALTSRYHDPAPMPRIRWY
jgi:hypothetical protein